MLSVGVESFEHVSDQWRDPCLVHDLLVAQSSGDVLSVQCTLYSVQSSIFVSVVVQSSVVVLNMQSSVVMMCIQFSVVVMCSQSSTVRCGCVVYCLQSTV